MLIPPKPFAQVRWADAHGSGTTEYAEYELPHQAAHYTAYGFVLRQDETGITLATEISDNQTYRGVSFIPAAMVVEVVELKLTKPKRKRATPPSPALPPGQSPAA